MDEVKYWTPEEIADKFRVSRTAVYEWVKSGKLRAVRLHDRIRIPDSAVLEFARPGDEPPATAPEPPPAPRKRKPRAK